MTLTVKPHPSTRRILIFATAASLTLLAAGFAFWSIQQKLNPRGALVVSGSLVGWKPYGGSWRFSRDSVLNDSRERGAKLLKGSTNWSDYAVESDVEFLDGNGGDAGLIVRSNNEERGVDSYSGYYVGLRERDSSLIIGRSNYGWNEFGAIKLRNPIQPNRWYHLRVVSVGCTIAASFKDVWTGESRSIAMNEEGGRCVTTGRVGLRSVSAKAAWKNIFVVPTRTADMQTVTDGVIAASQSSRHLTIWQVLEEYKPMVGDNKPISDSHNTEQTQPIVDLRLTSVLGTDHRAVRGKIILTTPLLVIQDSTGGASIRNTDTGNLEVGDEVLVRGRVDPNPFSASFQDASVTMLWPGGADPPFSITPSQAATGGFDDRFVELRAQLGELSNAPNHQAILDLHDGDQRFRALVDARTGERIRKLARESLVQVRGVCVTDPRFTKSLVPFAMLVRSADDITLISGPPWWSTRNLITGIVVTSFLVLLGYLFYIRAAQWRLKAVVGERLRLAHELHDTLAQSFAGIGYQLRAISKRLPVSETALREQVEITSELVRQGHQEARRSIATLRIETDSENVELLPALASAARRMISDGSIRVETSARGEPRRLPLKLVDVLFRVGQEAIANAVRHANASQITVQLVYEKARIQLAIEDDGIGFISGVESLFGFGLDGIRTRMRNVGGTLDVQSTPGKGTRLLVEAPLPHPSVRSYLWPIVSVGPRR